MKLLDLIRGRKTEAKPHLEEKNVVSEESKQITMNMKKNPTSTDLFQDDNDLGYC